MFRHPGCQVTGLMKLSHSSFLLKSAMFPWNTLFFVLMEVMEILGPKTRKPSCSGDQLFSMEKLIGNFLSVVVQFPQEVPSHAASVEGALTKPITFSVSNNSLVAHKKQSRSIIHLAKNKWDSCNRLFPFCARAIYFSEMFCGALYGTCCNISKTLGIAIPQFFSERSRRCPTGRPFGTTHMCPNLCKFLE